MRVCVVVGARPNFMKAAPILLELDRRGVDRALVHTGQHYDPGMSGVFFSELGLPTPDIDLGVGPGTHAAQTAAVMVGFEGACTRLKPAMVLVVGDVNSTVAAALTARKLGVAVGHVEAGLRSFDRSMPEEINRVVTDHLSDLLFATEAGALDNLAREGIAGDRVHLVGNCMVDTLKKHEVAAVARRPWREFGLEEGRYALLTLHRPSNVDDEETFNSLMTTLGHLSRRMPVLFPVHPRAAGRLERIAGDLPPSLIRIGPLPYLSFLGLMARAACVLTDSGGIQEETTALGIPCLTLRENTERPITIEQGTNRLVGGDRTRIGAAFDDVLAGRSPRGRRPELWDGHAAARVVDVVTSALGAN